MLTRTPVDGYIGCCAAIADFRFWDPLLPHLPAGLRLIRYDMRGHGLSDAPEGTYFMTTSWLTPQG